MTHQTTEQSSLPYNALVKASQEQEQVLSVHHWTDKYFSFRTTRHDGLRFENGQFVMVGMEIDGKLVRRAYSVASANWEEELEFFSIKVDDGKLTSQLQHIKTGDFIHIGRKPVGTLLLDDLHPGTTLWMLATGTGLAPFLAIMKDPDVYERFDNIVLLHGVRHIEDLAYQDIIEKQLPEHPYLGEAIANQFHYAPVVSREPFPRHGRITDLLRSGEMEKSLGLPTIDPANDRLMICGGTAMLADLRTLLDERGFKAAPSIGEPGDYVYERAFVSR
ncbi:MAG: ferredoxin--NADP reductase [Granulosicoccus sp.]